MSKLLEVNDNLTREAKYTLTIFNGEDAEVFINGESNMDLNKAGYWGQFIRDAAQTTIPLLALGSVTKTQDVWYRNGNLVDTCIVELSIDERDNILEFIAKGVKNKHVDFDKLEQLIFVVKIRYINSFGEITTRDFFTGRGKISTNSDTRQIIALKALPELLSETLTEHLIQGSTGANYNFINLQDSFEAICNSPHRIDDTYNYPITPFEADIDTYIPSVENSIEVTEQNILAGYEVYAEEGVLDTVLDPDKVYNEIDVFFYGQDPQCGWIEKRFTSSGSLKSQRTEWVNSWTFYTNQNLIDTYQNDDISISENTEIKNAYKSTFRMFRPFKRIIADAEIKEVILGELVINEIYKFKRGVFLNPDTGFKVGVKPVISFDDDATKIDIGNELIYCEQLMDFEFEAINPLFDVFNQTLRRTVLFNSTSNIYIYNKTKNVFYWKVVNHNVITLPLNYRWLDMSSNTGVPTRYDCQLENQNISSPQKTTLTFNPRLGYYRNTGSGLSANKNRQFHFVDGKRYVVGLHSMVGWRFAGNTQDDDDWDLRLPENDYEEMKHILQTLGDIIKPKTIKFDKFGKLFYLYNEIDGEGFTAEFQEQDIQFNFCRKDSPLTDTSLYNVRKKIRLIEQGLFWTPYEITSSLGNESVVYRYLQTNINDNYDIFQRECRFVDQPLNRVNRLLEETRDNNEKWLNNVYSYNNTTYVPFGNAIYQKADDLNPFAFLISMTAQNAVLDINFELDRMIYIDGTVNPNKISYAEIDSFPAPIYATRPNSDGIEFLFSMDRVVPNFTDTTDASRYYSYADNDAEPIRLLDLKGTRKQGLKATAKSFIKNIYNSGDGMLHIKNPSQTAVTFSDDMFISGTLNSKEYSYSRLEWVKYARKKQGFEATDNEEATSKETDESDFDENFSVILGSNIDIEMNITVKRSAAFLEWRATNSFGNEADIIAHPPSYSTFEIELTGVFTGIIIYFNFLNAELKIDKSFSGKIERRTLIASGIKEEIIDLDGKFLWKEDKNISLKFPLLHPNNSNGFHGRMQEWFVYAGRIRKGMIASFTVPQLILFKEDNTTFNIGEQRIIIDSATKYLNGYDLTDGLPTPFNDNKASFYIEKMVFNFKDHTTKFTLIGV